VVSLYSFADIFCAGFCSEAEKTLPGNCAYFLTNIWFGNISGQRRHWNMYIVLHYQLIAPPKKLNGSSL
jgi:hypothetical protein